jgi:predicted metal-dependent hydrolase
LQATDIYNEEKLSRQLEAQRRLCWDMETKIDWSRGVDLSKPLLPLDKGNILFPGASPEQQLVISQLMGLIVAATIAELEQVAIRLKGPTWEAVLDKYPVNPEFYELGQQFFREEAKHAVAFNRYVDLFSRSLGVEPDDLKSFLPQADKSISKKLYALNSLAGGMAMWWLIAAVEEESIVIFRYIHAVRERVDPLYYQLHRAHMEEESRHKSYALMMLHLFSEFSGITQQLVFRKVDFVLAECLNLTWTLNQLFKVKGLRRFRNHHPFFKTLESLMDGLGRRGPLDILHQMLTSAPYISSTLHLGEHKHVKELLTRFGALQAPLPSRIPLEARCML